MRKNEYAGYLFFPDRFISCFIVASPFRLLASPFAALLKAASANGIIPPFHTPQLVYGSMKAEGIP